MRRSRRDRRARSLLVQDLLPRSSFTLELGLEAGRRAELGVVRSMSRHEDLASLVLALALRVLDLVELRVPVDLRRRPARVACARGCRSTARAQVHSRPALFAAVLLRADAPLEVGEESSGFCLIREPLNFGGFETESMIGSESNRRPYRRLLREWPEEAAGSGRA
jgi:hypothetical protein